MPAFSWISIITSFLLAATASAEVTADKSSYNLFKPVPTELMREFNTDRPDKTESPYTVDAGHFQIETDLITYTHDQDESGAINKGASFFLSNIKAGLTNSIDLQLVLNPQSWVSSEAAGAKSRANGFGDTTVRLKWNFLGNDGGDIALGLMPFVKFATGKEDLGGNNKVEGGVILPMAIALPHDLGLGMMLQVNHAADETGGGGRREFISSATVSHPIVGELEGYAEFYSEASTEKDAAWVATGDLGLTYGLTPNVQLDAGANIGLTDAADDINLFTGISARF